MAILSVQDEFQSGDNVTATNLNNLVKDASFDTGAVDNATLQIDTLGSGYLKVKDNGILSNHLKSEASDTNDLQRAVTTNHIRNDAVTTAKIANLAVDTAQIAADAVEFSKMQNMGARTVIGNNTDVSANPTAIPIDDLKDSISNATQSADGLMSAGDKTKLDGVEAGATANEGTVTEVNTGTGLTGGSITGSGTIELANTTVTPSSYTNANITVDAQGRITAASSGSSLVPTGSVSAFAGAAAPTGYLLCDGSEVSRTTESDLFGVIGTTYGSGDNSTTFNLPDLSARVIAGMGGGLLATTDTLGSTGGVQEVTLTAEESGLPAHSHTVDDSNNTGSTDGSWAYGDRGNGISSGTNSVANNTAQDAASAHTNVQPTIILNYIIKT